MIIPWALFLSLIIRTLHGHSIGFTQLIPVTYLSVFCMVVLQASLCGFLSFIYPYFACLLYRLHLVDSCHLFIRILHGYSIGIAECIPVTDFSVFCMIILQAPLSGFLSLIHPNFAWLFYRHHGEDSCHWFFCILHDYCIGFTCRFLSLIYPYFAWSFYRLHLMDSCLLFVRILHGCSTGST